MSGNEIALLQDKAETNEQLPPIPTSVNELFDTEKLDFEGFGETKPLDKKMH